MCDVGGQWSMMGGRDAPSFWLSRRLIFTTPTIAFHLVNSQPATIISHPPSLSSSHSQLSSVHALSWPRQWPQSDALMATTTLDRALTSTVVPHVPVEPPAPLAVAIRHSANVWVADLRELLQHAGDRFGDVSWEVGSSDGLLHDDDDEDDGDDGGSRRDGHGGPSSGRPLGPTEGETIWGHKGEYLSSQGPIPYMVSLSWRCTTRWQGREEDARVAAVLAWVALPKPSFRARRYHYKKTTRRQSGHKFWESRGSCRGRFL